MSAPMTLAAALVRLRQYGERTSTWSTATYNDGTEKALHEIALTLAAEVDKLSNELTGANLTHWEDEQDHARLRLALESARRGRRKARERTAKVIAERDAQIIAWLCKKAGEYRSTRSRQHALQADAIDTMADKLRRGAVRPPLSKDADPLVVSRFDVAIEPAPEEEQLLTVGCIAEDGRPVALLLNAEDRAKVAEWLAPSVQLTPYEQLFLQFALELAADEMASRADEFDEADDAALESLRRLTGDPS
ncbi:hypothetical protein FKN01_29765 [Streptomyces sp. 130]|uniref:hypothetical protein n=1 Tax=Streptomyces sp. 130 TaxID=2591006 RepID=UPI00117D97BE|nr:hypothetical protein [Streptomyces sp. 130]TRV72578.1 hypothetical protein FKN01_29765 [Streptomyces sp. 130]